MSMLSVTTGSVVLIFFSSNISPVFTQFLFHNIWGAEHHLDEDYICSLASGCMETFVSFICETFVSFIAEKV